MTHRPVRDGLIFCAGSRKNSDPPDNMKSSRMLLRCKAPLLLLGVLAFAGVALLGVLGWFAGL